MKFILTFKTPDVLDQIKCGNYNDKDEFVPDEEADEIYKKFAKKFVEYGEYINVEFDTDNRTATVIY